MSPSCVSMSISASCSRIRLLSPPCNETDNQRKTGRRLSSLRLRLVPHLLAIHGAYRPRHVVGCGSSGGGTTAPGHGRQIHVAVGAVHPGTGLRSELRLLRVDAADGEQRKGTPQNEGDTWLAHSCSRDSQSTFKLLAKL